MTSNDITRMAHEAAGFDGTTSLERPVVLYAAMSKDFLDKFAALVAAAEREECAKLCDEKAKRDFNWASENADKYHAQASWAELCAKAIRRKD